MSDTSPADIERRTFLKHGSVALAAGLNLLPTAFAADTPIGPKLDPKPAVAEW